MKKTLTLTLFMLVCLATGSKAQRLAIKSNLLYDATTTMNLELEIGLAHKWTLGIPVNYNPWKFSDDARLRQWGVQPEVRYWFCERFRRTFIGVHGHYAEFNVGAWSNQWHGSQNMKSYRYQGYLYGGGASIGHLWIIKKRWGIEASAGIGYAHIVYDKFSCIQCSSKLEKGSRNYVGPTKASLSLIYNF